MAATGVEAVACGDEAESNAAVKVPAKFARRDQTRIEEAERRRNAKESQSVTEEKSDFFASSFTAERSAVERLLASCDPSDRDTASQTLEEATAKIQLLQKFLNDSIVFLSQYEIRHAQASLQNLQSSVAEKKAEVLPKKKFAFRSRNQSAGQSASVVAKSNQSAGKSSRDVASSDQSAGKAAPDAVESSQSAGKSASEDAKSDQSAGKASPDDVTSGQSAGKRPASDVVDAAVAPHQCGFSHVDNQVLVKQAEEIQHQDVLLSHLTNCKVRLYGCPSTLHIKSVRGCEILCGPVSSSVFVDRCERSTLAFPCQQLRTHNTSHAQIYLHVTSRAIIEDCQRVGFAPFTWTYPGILDHFRLSGLDPDRNNWTEVDDFNWLAAGTASPNWTVIPEGERRSSWDVL